MTTAKISIAESTHTRQVAQLHIQTINQGALPKLGPSFLQSLYRFLIPKGLIYLAHHPEKDKEFGLNARKLLKKIFHEMICQISL